MSKRVSRMLVVALTAMAAVFAFAGPAAASVGGCTPTAVITACVNYGDSGANTRADFYLNRAPDSDEVSYRVAIHLIQTNGNDYGAWVSPLNPIGGLGHYCCWTRNLTNLPPYYHGAKTVVYTYTASGVVHSVFTSPTIWYTS